MKNVKKCDIHRKKIFSIGRIVTLPFLKLGISNKYALSALAESLSCLGLRT